MHARTYVKRNLSQYFGEKMPVLEHSSCLVESEADDMMKRWHFTFMIVLYDMQLWLDYPNEETPPPSWIYIN